MATENRNPEIRKDTVNSRWVILSPARSRRPSDFKSKSPSSNAPQQCPFCAGNEHQCAPEIFRIPQDSTSDWKVRVIQNLYPALTRHPEPEVKSKSEEEEEEEAGEVTLGGFGFHDVIIESPVHSVHLPDLSPVEVAAVLLAYKKRIQQLCAIDSISYVQVFKNHGASAGASMTHSHSQMLALPFLPATASTRLDTMKQYHHQSGKCSLCDITTATDKFLIDRSTHFISIAPFASAFPFETWIIPRHHSSHYHELDEDKAMNLGGLLKLTLVKLSLQLNDPPYNFMIHTSPLQMGSGCYINPVFPEDAAKILREVEVQVPIPNKE